MSFQVPLLGEFSLAARTLERFQPIVAERVSLQAVQREEALRALGAQVRTLARVRARVHVQVTLAGEALPAAGARVRQLARVRAVVQQQLAGGQERLPTRGAQVILLPSVHLHVPRDARFAEAFPADGAQVGGARVQPLVLLEGVAAQESLVALAAAEYPSSLVEPLVLIVPRRAGESLLALAAVVPEDVKLPVGLQLIWMLKDLFARQALGLFLREDFVLCSHAQKPFVLACGLFPSPSLLVLQVVPFLFAFPLFSGAVFLLAFPLFVRDALYLLLFGVQLFPFLRILCFGLFHRLFFDDGSGYVVLTLHVLLHLPLYTVRKRTLGADEYV